MGSFRKYTATKQDQLELVLLDLSLHCPTFPLAVVQDPLWTKNIVMMVLVIVITIFIFIVSLIIDIMISVCNVLHLGLHQHCHIG